MTGPTPKLALGVATVALILATLALLTGGDCSGMNSCSTLPDEDATAEVCQSYRTGYRDSEMCLGPYGRVTFTGGITP